MARKNFSQFQEINQSLVIKFIQFLISELMFILSIIKLLHLPHVVLQET